VSSGAAADRGRGRRALREGALTTAAATARLQLVTGELVKLPAFLRRDFLVAWSYRFVFVSDLLNLALQTLMFYFVGLMVLPSKLPTFDGTRASYMEFTAVGIGVSAFLLLGLGRVALAVRGEQLMGTLESILMTPTAPSTIQLGSVFFDLLYVPLRTGLFLLVVATAFGLDFHAEGIAPAMLTLIVFIPFVWGLGILSAALTLTFRRGAGLVGLGAVSLGIFSGAYFPLTLVPAWLEKLSQYNPIARAMDGIRSSLIGTSPWAGFASDMALLVPLSVTSLAIGLAAFRLALARERRQGTLGLY
jgi:ABC-2 type transport system permease protein